jgi:hypothetical protein
MNSVITLKTCRVVDVYELLLKYQEVVRWRVNSEYKTACVNMAKVPIHDIILLCEKCMTMWKILSIGCRKNFLPLRYSSWKNFSFVVRR